MAYLLYFLPLALAYLMIGLTIYPLHQKSWGDFVLLWFIASTVYYLPWHYSSRALRGFIPELLWGITPFITVLIFAIIQTMPGMQVDLASLWDHHTFLDCTHWTVCRWLCAHGVLGCHPVVRRAPPEIARVPRDYGCPRGHIGGRPCVCERLDAHPPLVGGIHRHHAKHMVQLQYIGCGDPSNFLGHPAGRHGPVPDHCQRILSRAVIR